MGIKNAMATAASRYAEFANKPIVRGAVMITNAVPVEMHGLLLPIRSKSGSAFDFQIGRIGNFPKVANPTYRARYDDWEVDVEIKYLKNAINIEQIMFLLEVAGFAVGLHEYRPEKGGVYGRFRVKAQ
jgi:hypothetical protein